MNQASKIDILRRAIQEKLVVECDYGGYRRVLAPHKLGTTAEQILNVLCYQIAGTSSSGAIVPKDPQNWRCMAVDRMENLTFNQDFDWDSNSYHSQPSRCIAWTWEEIDY